MAAERSGRPRRPAARRGEPLLPGSAAPVRLEALRILAEVTDCGGNSSLLLERGVFASAADRGLATELVLGTLRRLRALDARLAVLSSRPLSEVDPAALAALRLGIYQLVHLDRVPAYAAVSATVEAAKRATGRSAAAFVNAVLRSFERRREEIKLPGPEDPEGYLTTTLSLPPFLARRYLARFGAATALALAEAAARPAATTLRVVTRRGSRDEVLASLAAEGIAASPGKYLEEAVRIDSGVAMEAKSFRQGKVWAQDEAAQMVARLVAPRRGELVLDAAAAPGGKALALADLSGGGATIVAADLRPGRLRLVRENVARVRPAGVHLVAADAARPPFLPGFDRILLDAPCTGTGTLRKNPEVRYRVDEASLASSRDRALALLEGVEPLLRPGGKLCYATCSLEPEENDEVIAVFLVRHPGYRRIDPRASLPASAHALVGADFCLRTQPLDLDLDGFTAFVLEKQA